MPDDKHARVANKLLDEALSVWAARTFSDARNACLPVFAAILRREYSDSDHKSLDQLAQEQGVEPASVETLQRLAGALPDLPPPRPRDEVSAKLKDKLAKARTAITDACNLLGTITCVPAVVREVSQLEQTLREIGDD